MCGGQWIDVRLPGPVPLGEQLPCTDLMVNTTMEHALSLKWGKVIVWDVTYLDTIAPPHGPLIIRKLGATYQYGWSEVFTYSIYSTVVKSIVKYKTQWTDSLYYVLCFWSSQEAWVLGAQCS